MGLTTKILAGLILGVAAGLGLGQSGLPFATTWIAPLGAIFMNMIKMIIVPLVFSSLVLGVAGLGDIKKIGRIGAKTVIMYLGTTAFAICLGIMLGIIFQPGAGLSLPGEGVKAAAKQAPPLMKVIIDIFPTNPIDAMLKANMLQIIVLSVFTGIGIVSVGERADTLLKTLDDITEVCYKIVHYIMQLAPIGVFGLICPVVAANGPDVLLPLAKVIVAVYLGCALHAAVVYGGLIKLLTKLPLGTFFRTILPAQLVAFTGCSSNGTLPVSMQCAENLGVNPEISSFVLPLGATINMDGTAIYMGIVTIFAAEIYGMPLPLDQQISVLLIALLASVGTMGVPGAALIMLSMIFTHVGIPLEAIALVAGIDRVMDMARTTINVLGDATAAIFISRTENDFDPQRGAALQDE